MEQINYSFINYEMNEEGIDLWIADNSSIIIKDEAELLYLIEQLELISNKIKEEPY